MRRLKLRQKNTHLVIQLVVRTVKKVQGKLMLGAMKIAKRRNAQKLANLIPWL